MQDILVGEDGFEPSKRKSNRFTVCPLWPLGNSPIKIPPTIVGRIGAGGRTRTPDLLITNQLLYQLSYTSTLRVLNHYIIVFCVCQVLFLFFSIFLKTYSKFKSGRGDRTRTCGILVPNQALYQTELRLVKQLYYYTTIRQFCQ